MASVSWFQPSAPRKWDHYGSFFGPERAGWGGPKLENWWYIRILWSILPPYIPEVSKEYTLENHSRWFTELGGRRRTLIYDWNRKTTRSGCAECILCSLLGYMGVKLTVEYMSSVFWFRPFPPRLLQTKKRSRMVLFARWGPIYRVGIRFLWSNLPPYILNASKNHPSTSEWTHRMVFWFSSALHNFPSSSHAPSSPILSRNRYPASQALVFSSFTEVYTLFWDSGSINCMYS